jgi:hypothetical protein
MENIISFLGEFIKSIISFFGEAGPVAALTLLFTILTFIFAIIIPKAIMAAQIYSDLLREYRSCEMGAAILSVFRFYVKDCEGKVENIADKYKEKYNEQIDTPLRRRGYANYAQALHKINDLLKRAGRINYARTLHKINILLKYRAPIDYTQTLHFQRRLIAQFYADFATLRYKRYCPCWLRKEQMRDWFTSREVKLLAIILHMAGPASKMFVDVGDVPDPKQDRNNVSMNKMLYKLYGEANRWVKAKKKRKNMRTMIVEIAKSLLKKLKKQK